jgi:hypothetical protein
MMGMVDPWYMCWRTYSVAASPSSTGICRSMMIIAYACRNEKH